MLIKFTYAFLLAPLAFEAATGAGAGAGAWACFLELVGLLDLGDLGDLFRLEGRDDFGDRFPSEFVSLSLSELISLSEASISSGFRS